MDRGAISCVSSRRCAHDEPDPRACAAPFSTAPPSMPNCSHLMGGALRLYDEPPRAAPAVYALFGDVKAADWSTDFDRGHEQDISIVVWAERGSARDALAAAERLAAHPRRCAAQSRRSSPHQPARDRNRINA